MKKALLIALFFIFKAFAQPGAPVSYVHNTKQKITITTEENKCILKYGQVNRIAINTENFDTRVLTFSGPGLRFVRPANPEQTTQYWEINLTDWERGKPYTLFFNYQGRKTTFSDSIKIPIQQ